MDQRFISTQLSIKYILFALILSALAACSSREYTQASGMGWIDFTITTRGETPIETDEPAYALTVASADGLYSHTWQSFSEYPKYEPYTVGHYHAEATSGQPDAEGFGCPCFYGEADFDVVESKHSTIDIECALTQAIIRIAFGEKLIAACPQAKATVHSSGHGYVSADIADDAKPIFLLPGTTYLYVTVQDASGRSATVAPDFQIDASAGNSYDISIEMPSESLLEVACGNVISQTQISDALFQSAEPSIEDVGFNSGVTLGITEGFPSHTPIKMIANAPAGLSAAILTSSIGSGDMPSECDLLSPVLDSDLKDLKVDRVGDNQLVVDFTGLLENIGVTANSDVTFMLQARDRLGRVSAASVLRISINSVGLTLLEPPTCTIGEGTASVSVSLSTDDFSADDFSVFIVGDDEASAKEAEIISISPLPNGDNTTKITFKAPEGLDDFGIRVDFMGNPKLFANVARLVPDYEIFVDAFALSANIYVTSENASLRQIIVDNAIVTANGANAAILSRDPDVGRISIAQLSPSTAYDISTVLIPGKFAPVVRATTEKAEQVPSGDFEDFEDLLQYKRLPCGGAYSNTVFPIYNMQNYADIDVKWPQKHWASTNAKTFCKTVSRANTWYMYPSAQLCFDMSASGTKSMQAQSVGWSLDGPEIPPYKQSSDASFLPYNNNVPVVDHKSAGKVFLGTYKFDPASLIETYNEGVSFQSRPRSLNGFYQYVSDPSVDDQGLIIVELVNDEGPEIISVATASMRFPNSPGFTSFNLPLSYHTIGVKATKLRIMFASSYRYGSIADEDEDVPVTPRPELGMLLGSTLRVDNLLFSY